MLEPGFGFNTRADVRQRLRELTTTRTSLLDAMHGLADQWQRVFRTSAPVHPVVQTTAGGYVYVRWRVAGRHGDQAYVDPSSDRAAHLWQSHPNLRTLLLDYWRRTLELNTAYSLANAQWRRIRQYLEDVQHMERNLAAVEHE